MTRDDIVAEIFARPKFGAGPGLARMAAVAASLPDTPWFATGHAIHVTGSHGKGTVATLTAEILRASGVRVGLFTSPHLHRFEERIRLDGKTIDARALTDAYRAFEAARNGAGGFGAFEVITGVALQAFAAAPLDTVVLEAGIGGRFDSTKSAGGALVALTAIDREHLDLLGPSELDVLEQKADLCPPGGTLLVGPLSSDLRTALEAYAHQKNIHVRFVEDEVRVSNVKAVREGLTADVAWPDLALPALETRLFGAMQMGNAALALLLARSWLERFGRFDREAFARAARAALGATALPLRFQRLGDTPPLYADVAHTPAALQALADTVRLHLGLEKVVIVLGVSQDKNALELARPLVPVASHILCTEADHRARAAGDLAALLSAQGWDVSVSFAPLDQALQRAQVFAAEQRTAVVVTGSLFLARDAQRRLSGGGAADVTL